MPEIEITLKEAIKRIQADIDDEDVEWDSPLGRAYKLSFEALKHFIKCRKEPCWLAEFLLPGETEA